MVMDEDGYLMVRECDFHSRLQGCFPQQTGSDPLSLRSVAIGDRYFVLSDGSVKSMKTGNKSGFYGKDFDTVDLSVLEDVLLEVPPPERWVSGAQIVMDVVNEPRVIDAVALFYAEQN